jgi:hypothetical protein
MDSHRKRQQSQFPDLTITGMYNVLEKLRSGERLTESEQLTHDQGLVSVLYRIHQDLDAAVFGAYGWAADTTDAAILEQLVALNAERALAERDGIVHWLRPKLQGLATEKRATTRKASSSRQLVLPWPTDLPHQVAAVRDLINLADAALSANDVATAYDGATPDAVVPALQTLEALGLAASYQNGAKRWKGLANTTGERIVRPRETERPVSRPPPASAVG